ncbi:LacI family DNA-binding transcriptional regulator [Carnobacterium sp.]|uniref:LacI family DNA-binding transcriptional regulator n=1 Tax=Carnobacterium sp. TaxID=48221 RepID=UPI0028A6FB1F|nr:LacI family DNA-binding transcriptional regulator [Carnobacterium sp.]
MSKTEPLYKLIYNTIKKQILTGVFPYNSQLPSEKELAGQFGVSRITSKRALNDLAKEGYIIRFPGKGSFVIFKGLPAERSYTISLLLPFFKNAGLEQYVQGISDYLKPTPFHLVIHSTQDDPDKQRQLIQSLSKETSDGVILYPNFPVSLIDLVYKLMLDDFPIVLLDKKLVDLPIPVVSSANFQGGYEATTYAIKQGHKNILFFSFASYLENSAVKDRYLGYLKALHEHQIQPTLHLQQSDYPSNMDQNHLLQSFLEQTKKQGYTCIIVEHDILALELISTAADMGWDIPSDMSFIGFDDLSLAHMITPNLTTVKQYFYQIGYVAAEKLLALITDPVKNAPPISIEVPIELKIRKSVQFIEHEKGADN